MSRRSRCQVADLATAEAIVRDAEAERREELGRYYADLEAFEERQEPEPEAEAGL